MSDKIVENNKFDFENFGKEKHFMILIRIDFELKHELKRPASIILSLIGFDLMYESKRPLALFCLQSILT